MTRVLLLCLWLVAAPALGRELLGVPIPLRDGCWLAADVSVPDAPGRRSRAGQADAGHGPDGDDIEDSWSDGKVGMGATWSAPCPRRPTWARPTSSSTRAA
ncbi:MAG: hypothetical protein HY319_22390 [Armatimonadetes bacterium]|nr:hypothetical protein [Armatimonadota bacterium]